ncbi:MAG: hypothetical protein R3C53_24510 [Pirellulaceae bacterium]
MTLSLQFSIIRACRCWSHAGCAGASVIVAFLVGCLTGCSTHTSRLAAPRQSFYGNNLEQAYTQLSKLSAKPKSDDTVVELDLALVELFRGDAAAAEQRLRSVRDKWDHLEQTSVAEQATSMMTDDSRRKYSGEDYEKLLVRVFLTLCSLMQDGVDAESYSLQTIDKHADLQQQARDKWGERIPESYSVPAIAPYLRGVLREATMSNYDDAARAYEQTLALQPNASMVLQDLERVTTGVHSSPGHGVVYVIALVGRGPYKIEVEQRATQEALLIADRILSVVGEYSLPPTLAPVKIPQIVCPPKPFDLVGIEVDGRPVSTTLPLTDLQLLANETYAAKLPDVMARTVARRVLKKGTVYAAKDQFEANSSIASLAFDAAGVLWEATESADTRCWGLLPREIQILRLELPVGLHQLHLEPVTAGRPVAAGTECSVQVCDGRNTYVLSYWPTSQTIGNVLVSD